MTDAAPPRRPGWLFTGLGVLGVALFLALGVWQVQRLAWKTALIAQVDARLAAAPVAAPGPADWAGLTKDDEYLRVSLTGHYLPGPQPLVLAVTTRGRGYWVMTPLRTEAGWTVFVNRGFIPEARHDDPPPAPQGEVAVEGLLRADQPGGGFLRSNDPEAGRWFSRDTGAMADTLSLDRVAPYFVDAAARADVGPEDPVGGLTVVHFRNSHLSYALTWFALALGLGALLAWLRLRRG